MRKIITAILLITAASFLNAHVLYAADFTGEIRIGLEAKCKEQASVAISNRSLIVGYETGGRFYDSGIITAKSNFTVVPSNLYYARLPGTYPTFEHADAAAKSAGVPAAACLTGPNEWSVYIGGYTTESDARYFANGGAVINPAGRIIALSDGGAAIALFDNANAFPQFLDAGYGQIALADRKYRGRIEFGRYARANITAVNVATMDEYLYSVVPAEMPKSFSPEALKAQAVASRTYAATKLGAHTGYELCDATHCQVYMGTTYESEATNTAVDMTRGILAYYDGKPIQASFFASSGGYTEDSENAWSNAVPYLRGVKELNETTAKQWTRTFQLSELTKLLNDNSVLIGSARGVSITAMSASGRVQELTISGTAGEKVLKKEEIRNFFSRSSDGILMSRMFTISNGSVTPAAAPVYITNGVSPSLIELSQAQAVVLGNTVSAVSSPAVAVLGAGGITNTYSFSQSVVSGSSDVITLVGSGNGHGVGLSQHGANGMAALGYAYDAILKYYYTGIDVR